MKKHDIKITDERTEWERFHQTEGGERIAVKWTIYTCPLCREKKATMLLDGSVVEGGQAAFYHDGHKIEHCGSWRCGSKARRMTKHWRKRWAETAVRIRWWMAGRLCRWAAWLRGQKWYMADTYWGTNGNRASELHDRIWQGMVMRIPSNDERESLEEDLQELKQLAGAAWE